MVVFEGIQLPDMMRVNEFGYTGLTSEVSRVIGNKVIVQDNIINLKPIDLKVCDTSVPVSRATLKQLHALSQVPNEVYTLTMGTATLFVRFRHESAPVIQADPVISKMEYDDTDMYANLYLRLAEVL